MAQPTLWFKFCSFNSQAHFTFSSLPFLFLRRGGRVCIFPQSVVSVVKIACLEKNLLFWLTRSFQRWERAPSVFSVSLWNGNSWDLLYRLDDVKSSAQCQEPAVKSKTTWSPGSGFKFYTFKSVVKKFIGNVLRSCMLVVEEFKNAVLVIKRKKWGLTIIPLATTKHKCNILICSCIHFQILFFNRDGIMMHVFSW